MRGKARNLGKGGGRDDDPGGRSSSGVVPVSFPGAHRRLITGEPVLEEVENGKLVARHDIRVGLSLDFAPDLGQRAFEDLADGWVGRAVGALARNFERLGDTGVLRGSG